MIASTQIALDSLAANLGIPSLWLDRLLSFESGFNPLARNPISGARGLIQFTNTTARGMGYASADDLVSKFPSASAQLAGPVFAYLNPLRPFPTEQSLYMAVFYPAARNWPLVRAFPAAVRAVNPGIITVSDYVRRVKRIPPAAIVAGILLVAGAVWWFTQHNTKDGASWRRGDGQRGQLQVVGR